MKFHVHVTQEQSGTGIYLFDDASVICSSYEKGKSWIFSPIQDPSDNQHPVSGNRNFGIKSLQNGTHEFYIRGVDRLTGFFDEGFGISEKMAFEGADKLWKAFQENLIKFIRKNHGEAEVDWSKYVWKRCKWVG